MWSLNILSCYYLGKSLLTETSLIDMFNLYFSYGGMRTSLIKSLNMFGVNMIAYILLSNILLFAVSFLFAKTKTKKHESYYRRAFTSLSGRRLPTEIILCYQERS